MGCGTHLIADLYGCEIPDLYIDTIERIVRKAAFAANATVLSVHTHTFDPCGMSSVAILSESHLSVHTWPERGFVAADIFTCGCHTDPAKAFESLKESFNAQKSVVNKMPRGCLDDLYEIDS